MNAIIRRLFALALCALLLLLSVAPASAASKDLLTISFSVTTYQNRARTLLTKLNALRKKNDLPALTMPADLEKVALQRASELFVHYGHTRPDMTGFDTADDAYKSVKGCLSAGESIAAGYSSADELMTDWANDDGALGNLLSEDFTHVGIACVQVPGSYNGTYWAVYLQQQKDGFKATKANSAATAGVKRTMTVECKKTMFPKADDSHKGFELRADDLNMKSRTTAQPTVYLYDKRGVQIGRCENADLTYVSGTTSVCTVLKTGVIQRKKAGTSTITVKFNGLGSTTFVVTIGGTGSASDVQLDKPSLTAKRGSDETTFSAYCENASGYYLYRCSTKSGSYRKIDEEQTTKRWTFKLANDDISKTYYYKVKAYKNVNGDKVFSEYSEPVKVSK